MPENINDLHVVGCTTDGNLWHTMRSPGRLAPAGTDWVGLGDVLAAVGRPELKGHVVDVACARRMGVPGVAEGLYVLVALDNEPPRLFFRESNGPAPAFAPGPWSQQVGPYFPTARKVAVGTYTSQSEAGDPGNGHHEIHLAAVADDGSLVAAFGDATENVGLAPIDVRATVAAGGGGDLGAVRAVALDTTSVISAPPVGLPLLAVFADGRLAQTRHTLVGGPGDLANRSWIGWTVLASFMVDADLAMRDVVAVTGPGTGQHPAPGPPCWRPPAR